MVRTSPRTIALRIALAVGLLAASGGALAFTVWQSTSAAGPAPITPQELVASVIRATSANPTISGDASTHVDLGLPDLSQLPVQPGPGSGVIGLLESISGDHTLRVWHAGTNLRVSDILPAAERSIYASKNSLWTWDSQTFTAHHLVPPVETAASNTGVLPALAAPPAFDPETLAKRALSAIEPTTNVSLGANTNVAGRDCYTLILEPNTSQTLVGRVEVNIDAETKLPLRVAVYARGAATPALSAQFSSVSYGPIDPSVFDFTPPAGAKVVQVSPPHMPQSELPNESAESTPYPAGLQKNVRVIGTGWSAVVAVRVPPMTELKNQYGDGISSFIPYSGPLVSATIVDRGDHSWVIAGAVPQSALASVEPELT